MNMLEIARRIDKSPENEAWVNLENVAEALHIPDLWAPCDQDRLKAYWIGRWRYNDSVVGYRMYFFDGEPVAYSGPDRSEEVFDWFSKEAVVQVKAYVESLIESEQGERFSFYDLEKDIGNTFKIPSIFQVEDWERARYQRHPIDFVGLEKEMTVGLGCVTKVHIHVPETGQDLVVDVKELDFEFFLNRDPEKDKITEAESLEDQIKAAERKATPFRDEGPGTAELCRDWG